MHEKTKERFPHFRYLKYKEGPKSKKKRHPKIILQRRGNRYDYMGMTEEPKRGHHANIPLERNPKKGDKRPAFVRKELLSRPTEDFMDLLSDYHLSKSDKKKVLDYVEKLKRKKYPFLAVVISYHKATSEMACTILYYYNISLGKCQ